jgi:uncharacterized protein (DUF1697 family)
MALVTFLRGVNVGGHRTFRPSVLARQLEDYGVVNIGAAGTFVIRKQVSKTKLRSELLRRLPFEAEVMICTGEELIAAASDNPFQSGASRSGIVRFVSILGKRPQLLPSMPVCIPAKGKWLVRIRRRHDRFLFGEYRREMKAITCLGKIDGLFGVPVTTRGWNTINAILKVLKEGAHMPTRNDTLQDTSPDIAKSTSPSLAESQDAPSRFQSGSYSTTASFICCR